MADLSHRRILKIAVPIVLANVTVPLLGLVDTGVVGQLGAAEPIGAVAIGAMILTSIYWVFGFLRMGTTGLTSQAIGAGHAGEVSALLFRGLLLGGGFGAVIILLQMPIFALSLYLSPGSVGVEALAHDYMSVRVWSAPAAIALYAVNGWLIAAERTRAVLLLQIVMNGTNILLDVLFVLGLGWGVAGVAGATFIAEWLGLALGLWLCRDALRTRVGWPAILDPARLEAVHRPPALTALWRGLPPNHPA
uniref:MATE family efflux transporter n=1 Tax=Marivivens sp. TaxID=1978374 RepID=UPI0025C6E18B